MLWSPPTPVVCQRHVNRHDETSYGFCSRDEECTCLMDHIESPEIDIAAIHDVNRSCLQGDQVQREGIAHFTVGNMDETGIGPRRSSSVCILTAALVERKSAHGDSERHKSIVVLSSAYTVLTRSRPISSSI